MTDHPTPSAPRARLVGLFSQLTPEQQVAALNYDGPEDLMPAHGPSPYRYIPCRCYCAEHFIRVELDQDVRNGLLVEVISTRNGSFWHRLKWATRHVFGWNDLVFADLMISSGDWLYAGRLALSQEEGHE